MSQFMYLQRAKGGASLEGTTLHSVDTDTSLQDLFSNRGEPIWEVRPDAGTLDNLVDRAREEMRSGGDLRETALGLLLRGAIERHWPFCLCWGRDREDLPEPQSEEELFDLLQRQLDSDGSRNWGLYAMWRAA